MAVFKDFECRLRLPECDPDRLDQVRKDLRELIDGDDFSRMMGGLKATAAQTSAGQKPKDWSGEARIEASTGSRGETRVGASVSIRW